MTPKLWEYVTVIDNKSMKEVVSGRVIKYTRDEIVIELPTTSDRVTFDARVHHFKGYEPSTLLIKKE